MSVDIKVVRRPRAGDVVVTRFGDAAVVKVHRFGRRLTVATPAHGTELVERADNGWWVVKPKGRWQW